MPKFAKSRIAGHLAMTLFFDTSVLIPAYQLTHTQHEQSSLALAQVRRHTATCGAHSIAEFYSVLTRMPPPYRFHLEQALLCIDEIAQNFRVITLDAQEHLSEVRRAAENRTPGGQLYDALLLACARKAKADKILTWNLKHFRLLAPDLADRIVTP